MYICYVLSGSTTVNNITIGKWWYGRCISWTDNGNAHDELDQYCLQNQHFPMYIWYSRDCKVVLIFNSCIQLHIGETWLSPANIEELRPISTKYHRAALFFVHIMYLLHLQSSGRNITYMFKQGNFFSVSIHKYLKLSPLIDWSLVVVFNKLPVVSRRFHSKLPVLVVRLFCNHANLASLSAKEGSRYHNC